MGLGAPLHSSSLLPFASFVALNQLAERRIAAAFAGVICVHLRLVVDVSIAAADDLECRVDCFSTTLGDVSKEDAR